MDTGSTPVRSTRKAVSYTHLKKTPYFVLVLDGIHDKIYPWSKELPDLLPDGTKPQNQESVIASTEMTDEENVAGQTETVMQDTETAAAKRCV